MPSVWDDHPKAVRAVPAGHLLPGLWSGLDVGDFVAVLSGRHLAAKIVNRQSSIGLFLGNKGRFTSHFGILISFFFPFAIRHSHFVLPLVPSFGIRAFVALTGKRQKMQRRMLNLGSQKCEFRMSSFELVLWFSPCLRSGTITPRLLELSLRATYYRACGPDWMLATSSPFYLEGIWPPKSSIVNLQLVCCRLGSRSVNR